MEIKLLSCPLCLKPHFPGVDSLRSSLIAAATSPLSCPVCNESLLGLDKLTIHLFTHITETQQISIQPPNPNKSEEEIDESIDKISKSSSPDVNDEAQIKCDICNFSFTDKTILDMHQKLLHQTIPDKNTGMYNYHCHLCSKKFKMRGSLMVHLRVAHWGFPHDQETPEHSPITTPKEATSSAQSPKMQDNKQWKCDVCSKMFTTKYFLKKHKRLHTGEMPYFCAQCNKYFTFQQSYHKHMLYHSSEKPYVCNECGRAFKELSTLQNHARIHSGERPFECETCGKRFRQRVSYLVHRRIHTGVMPYKCTACEKSFRYKVSQRSHKCPMNPPGSVIRVEEPEVAVNDIKCVMAVDYTTGSINVIQKTPEIGVAFLENRAVKSEENLNKENLKIDVYSGDQPDLFSMVLSPLLPEVESLCLTSSSMETTSSDKPNEDLQVINEESLKELLYGPNRE